MAATTDDTSASSLEISGTPAMPDRLEVQVTEGSDDPGAGPAGGPATLTVVIVDDHELIRHGLRRAFERTGDFTIAAEAGTVADAMVLVDRHHPDVVVTDIQLPDGDGISLAAALRQVDDRLGIVVLTMYGDDEHLMGALTAKASAFVNKDAPVSEVVDAARQAARNPRNFSAPGLSEAIARWREPKPGPTLSARETDVLLLLVEGLSAGQMARRLFISESTVKTHISKMYDKLGATNRAQAVMAAVRLGLVPDAPAPRS